MAEKDPKDAKEERLVPVGEGAEEAPEETLEEQVAKDKKAESSAEEETDERVGHEEDSDDDGPEGETVEQKRERRRTERKNRREKDARLRREVNFLRQRNEQLERKFSETNARVDQQEVLTIDSRINGIAEQIRQAEQIHAKAVETNDGATATEALRIKDELLDQKRRYQEMKTGREAQRENGRQKENGAPPVDPGVKQQAQAWFGRNSDWFDPTLSDETSHLVKVMEDRLSREGEYEPSDPEYWAELDRRIAQRFPGLKKGRQVNGGDDEDEDEVEEERPTRKPPPKKAKGGPRFSVGGRERALGRNEVYIDAERRKALEDLGAWDDPVLRDRYLKSYAKYDAEAAKRK